MRFFDRVLQRWRIRESRRYLVGSTRIIDIGAFHGELFLALGARLREGFGIEPLLNSPIVDEHFTILPGFFPDVRPPSVDWDAITMLAVFEHIPEAQHQSFVEACHALLRDNGRVIITVPAPAVDKILAVLKFVRLIDGMSLEEHHGYRPDQTPQIFSPPLFRLAAHRRFQLGLNYVFVFEKCRASR